MPFKKGYHPSEEVRKKMSEARKGITSWNKGKTGIYSKKTLLQWSKIRTGRKHSIETKRKMSKYTREQRYNWKGGSDLLDKLIRHSFLYRQWRSDIFARDDFTCQECGKKDGSLLNAHHIKRFSNILQKYEITTLEEALDCNELWDINNGITLCLDCHSKHARRLKNVLSAC